MSKSGDCHLEVVERIQKASRTFCSWKRRVFTNREFSKNTKLRVFRSLVMPVLVYGCETWESLKSIFESKTEHFSYALYYIYLGCIKTEQDKKFLQFEICQGRTN